MAQLITVNGKYNNAKAVSNVIRYITRTRLNEDRRNELITCGSPNVTCIPNKNDIELAIREFKDVQKFYNDVITGRRVFHETFNLSDEEAAFFIMPWQIENLSLECSRYYASQGFQVVYGAHYSQKYRLHIHFCVNAVNYITGKKYHSDYNDHEIRSVEFNRILYKHIESNKIFVYNMYCAPLFYYPGMITYPNV